MQLHIKNLCYLVFLSSPSPFLFSQLEASFTYVTYLSTYLPTLPYESESGSGPRSTCDFSGGKTAPSSYPPTHPRLASPPAPLLHPSTQNTSHPTDSTLSATAPLLFNQHTHPPSPLSALPLTSPAPTLVYSLARPQQLPLHDLKLSPSPSFTPLPTLDLF